CLVPSWRLGGVADVAIRMAFVAALFLLPRAERLQDASKVRGPLMTVNRLLASPLMRWMGDVSYGVYLLHLLLLIPIAGWVARELGADAHGVLRFATALTITAAITYAVAHLLHLTVEQGGIRLGKRLLQRRPRAVSVG